jgi:hypothetical protein
MWELCGRLVRWIYTRMRALSLVLQTHTRVVHYDRYHDTTVSHKHNHGRSDIGPTCHTLYGGKKTVTVEAS